MSYGNRDRKLLITAKIKDGVLDKTGTGCPYELPIENPTWLSIMDIATMFSAGKCEITCHNTSAPQVMTLAMYEKLIFQEKITDEMIQKAYDDSVVTPPTPEGGGEESGGSGEVEQAKAPLASPFSAPLNADKKIIVNPPAGEVKTDGNPVEKEEEVKAEEKVDTKVDANTNTSGSTTNDKKKK